MKGHLEYQDFEEEILGYQGEWLPVMFLVKWLSESNYTVMHADGLPATAGFLVKARQN